MIEYDRNDLDEGIDINKTSNSRECSLCKFYYFLNKNFNYKRHICDGCHDTSLKAISMQNIAIIYHNGHTYRVNFAFISRNDALNLMKNSIIIDKKGVLAKSKNKAKIK